VSVKPGLSHGYLKALAVGNDVFQITGIGEGRKYNMANFKVGKRIVYPAHGVAEVDKIETKNIGGIEQSFYVLRLLDSGMTLMVPTANEQQVGMRELVDEGEADKVFDVLRKKEKIADGTTWNRRHRDYMEKIKTGSVFEVAKVLRDLYVLKGDKELSFGERKMLDTARSLLMMEISIAKKISISDVENKFKEIFRC
jgi:CarD family transcriptional regulator